MQFDYIIHGGKVVDGTGEREPFLADVGVIDDRIAAIGKLDSAQANQRINAAGQVISPGFIDVHVHSEISLLGGRDQLGAVRQGVTTQLTAPDGFGWAPASAGHSARDVALYAVCDWGCGTQPRLAQR